MNCTSVISQAYTFDVAILSQIVLNTDVFFGCFSGQKYQLKEEQTSKNEKYIFGDKMKSGQVNKYVILLV